MRKIVAYALFTLVIIGLAVQPCRAEDMILKKHEDKPGEWTICNQKGEPVGILRSMEDGAYSVQFNSGEYLGVIVKTGALQTNKRHPLFTPTEAQFYLDVLKAIQTLK